MIHSPFRPVALFFVLMTLALIARAEPRCTDFLKALHKKPTNLKYLGCKQQNEMQGQPLEASYRVTGSHAAEVEQYLVKELKLKKLRRVCCIWESTENSYQDEKDELFVISMSTDETLIAKKSDWSRIPFFYVKVDRFREDP